MFPCIDEFHQHFPRSHICTPGTCLKVRIALMAYDTENNIYDIYIYMCENVFVNGTPLTDTHSGLPECASEVIVFPVVLLHLRCMHPFQHFCVGSRLRLASSNAISHFCQSVLNGGGARLMAGSSDLSYVTTEAF